MRRLLIIIFIIFFTKSVMAAGLSPTEINIRDDIANHTQPQLALLEQLVNINSGTTNLAGVHRVGEIVRHELDELGFKTRWEEEPAKMQRAGTLIAERQGKKGKRLLLIGHLDTVFAPNSPFKRFELHKNSAKGPGVIDDKGGVVVILSALKALQAAHVLDDTTITVILTGDEEDSGKPTSISRKPLIEAAKHSDIALDFEPTVTLATATIGRRGVSRWTLSVQGNEAHSATIFQKEIGAGAIFELSRILNAMRSTMAMTKDVTFNPGVVLGGTALTYDDKRAQATVFGKDNVVAKIALAKGDYRFLTLKQKQAFEQQIGTIVKQHLPGTRSTVSFQAGIPAMSPTEANMALLKTYSEASQDLNLGKVTAFDPTLRGAGDISHVAAIVPANLAGLGPMGAGAHSVSESIELNSLPIQTQRAAILIYRLILA